MTTAPVTLRAAQLIYTNVEADDSPTRRRGFQVWLHSPGLSESLRREVAKRLGDFRLPTAIPPDAPVRRHVYFAADEHHWVVAQTVPLAEKDMFGRGGRFYAHAYVVAAAEFAKVHFNPFALLDGGAAFQASLADGKAAAPGWKSGHIDEVELHLAPPAVAAAPPLLRELATVLERPESNPIAIPEPPAAVLAFLRALLGWLPPALRRAASFDTLSTGQSLSTVPYRFAGAVSADNLRRWAYRRAARLDLVAGKLTPPVPEPSFVGDLLARWAAAGRLPPAEQAEAAYRVLRAVTELRPDDCRPDELTPELADDIVALPGVPSCLETLRAQRLETDLPDPVLRSLVAAQTAEYLAPPDPLTVLRRIAEPVPAAQLADWLLHTLDADPPPRLSVDDARRLAAWAADTDGPAARRCKLIAVRWLGDSDKIHGYFERSADEPEQAWLRGWVRRTLDATFPGDGNLAARVRDALDAGEGAPEQLAEAQLFLALGDAVGLDAEQIRLLLAFHRAQAGGLAALLAGPSGEELREYMALRIEEADARVEFRAAIYDGDFHFGVEVLFRGRNAHKLVALGIAFYDSNPARASEYWMNRAATGLPPLLEGRIQAANKSELHQYLKKGKWEDLTDQLRTVTDSSFQDFTEPLASKYSRQPAFNRTGDCSFWLGLRLTTLDPRSRVHDNNIMRAIMESVLPVPDIESWVGLAAVTPIDSADRYRAAWLLTFLRNPVATMGKYSIARS